MKTFILTTATLLAGITAGAQTEPVDGSKKIVTDISVANVEMERTGKLFVVDMDMLLNELDVKSNRAVLITPSLKNGQDSVELPSLGIYGRKRYYYYVRNGESMLTANEQSYRAKERPGEVDYHQVIDYHDWINGATLHLTRQDFGCCSDILRQETGVLGTFEEFLDFFPKLVFMQVKGVDSKERSLDGSAFVDFRINETAIDPNYRKNSVELGKISNTIDSLRVDGDITIKSVWLKGYASPEGSYTNNARLAKGRTEALRKYISKLYQFPQEVVLAEHEPENWEGLRSYVEKSSLQHRKEILAIIDSNLQPDPKNNKIKDTYLEEYRTLLKECYPALRRTDYKIAYNIRTYADIEEMKEVMRTAPQKLSLNEFYLLSEQYEPGTDEFTNVFETAVRMYPDDEVANLNAANAAMRRGDLNSVPGYLQRAGTSPEVTYASASYEFLSGNYDKAKALFQKAKEAGIEQATLTLDQFDKRAKAHARSKRK